MDGETRSLTEPERRYVQWHRSRMGGSTWKQVVLGSGAASGCISLPILGIASGVGFLSSFWKRTSEGQAIRIAVAVIVLIPWAGILIAGLFQRRKEAAKQAEDRHSIDADLAGGITRIHRFRATDVMLAYDDERRGRNYFVRLDDGRILFLGPWRPEGCKTRGLSFVPDEKGFPSTTFEIAATPNYLLILDVVGTGDFLRPSDEFELNEDQEAADDRCRLEAGRFVKVPWEEIRKTFG